uniref:Purine nucleoside phosphorylase n=1 Tax=Thermodesulfovibrio aggregans TaxID=86166 RepID=A0A7C4AJ39_9BACT
MDFPAIFKNHPVKAFFTKRVDDFDKFKDSLPFKIYLPVQRHTDRIIVLQNYVKPEIADAVITDKKGIFIGIKTADCLPVLIFDPEHHVAGALHAGWRGTANSILRKTIQKMKEFYGSDAGDLLIAMGPSIKGCCYEVGEDVIEAIKKENPVEDYILRINGRKHLDLSLANLFQALTSGVKRENIWISQDCTYCKSNEYASYRFHGKKAGRQYAVIGML